MDLRGLRAGYLAAFVAMGGAGTAAAFPPAMQAGPAGGLSLDPQVQILPVAALTEDEAVAMLEAEGYVVVEKHRTWLGRIVITAEGDAGRREIVLHPYDGQVLRDVIVEPAEPALAPETAETVVKDTQALTDEAAEAAPVVVDAAEAPTEAAP